MRAFVLSGFANVSSVAAQRRTRLALSSAVRPGKVGSHEKPLPAPAVAVNPLTSPVIAGSCTAPEKGALLSRSLDRNAKESCTSRDRRFKPRFRSLLRTSSRAFSFTRENGDPPMAAAYTSRQTAVHFPRSGKAEQLVGPDRSDQGDGVRPIRLHLADDLSYDLADDLGDPPRVHVRIRNRDR